MNAPATIFEQRVNAYMIILDAQCGQDWPLLYGDKLTIDRYHAGTFGMDDLRRATASRLAPSLQAGIQATLIIIQQREP